MQLERFIRDIPDFPKEGIVFKDITPLLADADALRASVEQMAEQVKDLNPDVLLGIESRGFLFGAALAVNMGLGLLIARKPGKLPYEKDSVSYDLEYGSATLELHVDAVKKGQRVLIIDDLLATGGTAAATAKLVEKQGGQVAGFAFVIELGFLEGRNKLTPHPVKYLLKY
ncbi:MAG: adenine phosphoribosyltransferase [Deltaproteobacteria bacterium]|nr:adenine phosphoribosyltransferase [Deltaproteobacteria bacterium]